MRSGNKAFQRVKPTPGKKSAHYKKERKKFMSHKMSLFSWTLKRRKAAFALAEGVLNSEAAQEAGVSERTIYRWKHDIDFSAEVDRLTLMTGIAVKVERIKIAKRVARQSITETEVITKKDLLDWLQFAQSETDGIKLNLTELLTSFSKQDELNTGGESDGEGMSENA
jgi:transposase